MILQTRRLTLYPIRADDAAALHKARGDVDVMRYWDWPARDKRDCLT